MKTNRKIKAKQKNIDMDIKKAIESINKKINPKDYKNFADYLLAWSMLSTSL